MLAITSEDVLKCYPYKANGVTITPSAVAFNNSAWVEVHPSTPEAWAIAGVMPVQPAVSNLDIEFDVGVGALGLETPVATYIARSANGGVQLVARGELVTAVMIARVPAASRVSVRMRKTGTNVSTWRCKVKYYPMPVTGIFNTTTTMSPYPIPSAASGIIVTTPAAPAWADSAYGVLTASLPVTSALLGVCMDINANGPEYQIDLATGPALSEVDFATLTESSANVNSHFPGFFWFPTPLGPIAAGTRIAFRGRRSTAAASAIQCKLLAIPFPF